MSCRHKGQLQAQEDKCHVAFSQRVRREKNILCALYCLHYSTIYVKYKSTLKFVSRVSNTITLPLRLAALRYSFWSSRDSRLLLTRGKSPQRALDIQEHLVVVLVIVSLYGFWKKKKKKEDNLPSA